MIISQQNLTIIQDLLVPKIIGKRKKICDGFLLALFWKSKTNSMNTTRKVKIHSKEDQLFAHNGPTPIIYLLT